MTTRKFIKSIVIDIVVFISLIIIITAIANSVGPLITTDNALGQMENSNEMYILMNTYNRIQSVFRLLYAVVILGFGYTIVRDNYNYFIKNEKEKN